jgi:hypothetical protein
MSLGIVVYTNDQTGEVEQVSYFPGVSYAATGSMPFAKVMDRSTDSQQVNLLRVGLEKAIEGKFPDKRNSMTCPEAYVIEELPEKESSRLENGLYLGPRGHVSFKNTYFSGGAVVGYLGNSVGIEGRLFAAPTNEFQASEEVIEQQNIPPNGTYTLTELTTEQKETGVSFGLGMPIRLGDKAFITPYVMVSPYVTDVATEGRGKTQLFGENGPTEVSIEYADNTIEKGIELERIGADINYQIGEHMSLSLGGAYQFNTFEPDHSVSLGLNYHFNK